MSFTPALYEFLGDLADHNDREWFAANKARYEADVREPALEFVRAFEPYLADISPHFRAIAKAAGGSMFRIHRDTRFSKDKSPYKTHVGIHFRHGVGDDVHAPGFYLHLEQGQVRMGAGIWHPDNPTLGRLREAIAARPDEWGALKRDAAAEGFAFMGESLKRPPRGFDPDHPHVEDLMRKDMAVIRAVEDAETMKADFPARYAALCQQTFPLVAFLCDALGLPA